MNAFSKLGLAAVAVAALSAGPAWAQGRGGLGMMGMAGGGSRLLTNKGVQHEIKATEDQVSRLEELGQKLAEKGRETFQGIQDLGEEERRDKMMAMTREMNEEVERGIKEVLKPEQIKRFHQIEVQQSGHNAFMMPRVAAALKLTDDQKSKIAEVGEGMQGALREAFQDAQGDRAAMMAKMRELRKDAMDKAVAVLSADQKDLWKDMIGAPYEVQFERRQPN